MNKYVAIASAALLVGAVLFMWPPRHWQKVYAADQAVVVSYEEPTESAPDDNGAVAPLDDLAFTRVYHSINGEVPVAGPNVLATGLVGGQTVTTTVTVILPTPGKYVVEIWATATDTSGNESDRSNVIVKRFDFVKPKPPTGLR